ncbi:MAG: GTPase Era, partial [Xanthomonadaceae bacterium]|nr:GTPase Era [Xanthomonadaceae bacterium]
LGIKTSAQVQAVYVDTPGLHRGGKRAMNRYMNRAATDALQDVDVVVFVVEGTRWTDEDELVLEKLRQVSCPVILAINKIDRVVDKKALLPYLQQVSKHMDFTQIIPLSAKQGSQVGELEQAVEALLPESTPFYPEDQVTDRSMRFMAAELVREKLFRKLGQELPYGITVEIEQFKEEDGLFRINALIWVERDSQKAIVIGKQGVLLREVGRESRIDMEEAFGQKVFLELWVKVKEGWADDERALRSLGYDDQ